MTFSNKINTEQGQIQSWPLLKQHIFYPTKSNYLHHLKNTIKTQIYPKYNLISLQKESILTVKNILFLVWGIPQINQKTKILILSNSIFIKTFYGKLTLQISFMSECLMIFKSLTNSLLEKVTIPLWSRELWEEDFGGKLSIKYHLKLIFFGHNSESINLLNLKKNIKINNLSFFLIKFTCNISKTFLILKQFLQKLSKIIC